MSSPPALHQWLESCIEGDLALRQARRLRQHLQALGLVSRLYVQTPAANLPDDVLAWSPEAVVSGEPWCIHLTASGVLPNSSLISRPHVWVCHADYLPTTAPRGAGGVALGTLALSQHQAAQLRSAGFPNVFVVPLWDDAGNSEPAWDRALTSQLRERLTVVAPGPFGSVAEIQALVGAFQALEHFATQPVRLVLLGELAAVESVVTLPALLAPLLASDRVRWLPCPTPAEVEAVLRCSELCVVLGADARLWEGVAAALRHDVPVLARDTPALAGLLEAGGLVLESQVHDSREIAASWHLLLTEPGVRQRVLQGQRTVRRGLQAAAVCQRLRRELTCLGGELPALAETATPEATAAGIRGESGQRWQLEGPLGSTYSLAIVNRRLAEALQTEGQDTGLRRLGEDDNEPNEWDWVRHHEPQALALAERDLAWREAGEVAEVALRFHYPPWVDGMRGLWRVVHSYGWEETAFPEPYVHAFNRRLDGVTTLATEVSKALRDSGVRLPMVAVGTGVDHVLRVAPEAVVLGSLAQQARFRFLHVSSCFPRKGPDVLLAAWGRAFRASDDVVLVIKTFPNPHNDVAQQLDVWRARDPDYPAVEVINQDVSQAQMNWLYRYCDALVAPSRGEGFGMPMAEAMLFDLPVIVTGWGGQTDFCTPETAWLCDFQFAYSGSHLGVPHSAWAEPSVEHLAALMREVWQLPAQQRQARTAKARERVLRDYSWAAVARRTQAAVARFAAAPVLRAQPRIAWVSTWNVRCGIANYSRLLLRAFSPDRLAVLALPGGDLEGVDEPWVVRCDPAALAHDAAATLLAEVDRLGLEVLVLQYNFGFFSLEALARLLQGLHQRGVTAYVFLHATDDAGRVSLGDIAADLRLAERLVVHSVVDLNRLKGWGLADKVLLFPHGVPDTPAEPGLALRDERGLVGKRVVASYGFLLPHKGMQILIRAFADLASRDADLHLLLVCAQYPNPKSAQELQDCDALIRTLNLEQRVTRVHDFLPDAESLSWLQMADVVVFPYQYTQESSSAAVRGGLAAGRPVVVTPLEIFDDVAEGVGLLPGTDAAAIAHGLGQLLGDAEALEALRVKGVQWCDARRWSRVSVRLLNVIDGVANDAV